MYTAQSSGQALLIILLVMAVALTIGLSVIARSITDIAISQKEEEAARAFSAAEAGIEQALIATCSSFPCNPTVPSLTTGSVTSLLVDTLVSSGGKTFVHPQALSVGESASVWLVAHDSDGNLVCNNSFPCFTSSTSQASSLQFCWGKSATAADTSTTPALAIMMLYMSAGNDYSSIKVARAVYDPNSTRRTTNGMASPDSGTCTISGQSFAFTKTVVLESGGLGVTERASQVNSVGPQVARVRLLYNTDQTPPVGLNADFSGNGSLPQQGTKIISTGISGNATRKLEVYKLYSDLPSIFDYALFSGTGGIVK